MSNVEGKTDDPIAVLLAQLHYDRADVAQLSGTAAAVMDLVIKIVADAGGHESVWEPDSPDPIDNP